MLLWSRVCDVDFPTYWWVLSNFSPGCWLVKLETVFSMFFFCDIFLVIWQYARTRIFADFRQYEGLLPQTSGELLAPKRFLNVWTCAWFCGFATIFWGKETTYKMFLNSNQPFFLRPTHTVSQKKTRDSRSTEVNVGYFGATALLESITRSGAIKTGFIEFFVRSSCIKNLGASRIRQTKTWAETAEGSSLI